MKSKTSFFNKEIFLSNIRRFWPIWAAYLIIWLIMMPLSILSKLRWTAAAQVEHNYDILSFGHIGGTIMAFIFAIFAAMAVFSHMYTQRSAGMTTSLPIKREGMFISNCLSVLFSFFAANILIFLITPHNRGVQRDTGHRDTSSVFAMVNLQMILMFGIASLCAVLTGISSFCRRCYVVLNFTAVWSR
jgi:ABC-2 type transport system permease protein